MPPGFGFFVLALLFQSTRFLRGLGHGLVAVCLQQLPGVVLNFDFLHSHGVMLLSTDATGTAGRARERQPLTPIKTCKSYLSAVSRPPQGGIRPSPGRRRGSIEAPRFHQEGKRIEVEVRLEIAPEQTEPSLLRHVGELLALLRTRVLEPTYVLNMMNHFVH